MLLNLSEGEPIPFYYGFGWIDVDKHKIVAYPIPLNLILRFLRSVILRLRLTNPKMDALEKAYKQGYEKGWIVGWNEAYKEESRSWR